jgi:polar amino acid transport system substrate-binding protein
MRILLFIFMLLSQLPASAAELRVISESNPPFNYENLGQPTGIATDIFLLMADLAGMHLSRQDIDIWPWARGYQEIQKKSDVILFSMAKTETRKDLFQWIGPIMPLYGSLIALKERNIHISDPVKDAKSYRFGTIRASASEQYLIGSGIELKSLHPVHDLRLNASKLHEKRIDIMVANESAAFYTIRQMGYDPADFEVVHRMLPSLLYFAASRDMDPAIVQRLQTALDQLKADGTVERIINEYR